MACVVKLQDHHDDVELPTVQQGIKGHVTVFPQHPETVTNLMPTPLSDIITPISIVFHQENRVLLLLLIVLYHRKSKKSKASKSSHDNCQASVGNRKVRKAKAQKFVKNGVSN